MILPCENHIRFRVSWIDVVVSRFGAGDVAIVEIDELGLDKLYSIELIVLKSFLFLFCCGHYFKTETQKRKMTEEYDWVYGINTVLQNSACDFN